MLLAFAFPGASAQAFSPQCCSPWQQGGQMAIAPDGNTLYVADYTATLALRRDPATGALSLIDSYSGGGGLMELSPDGRHLYVTGGAGFGRSSTIIAFEREPTTGALARVGRWEMSVPGAIADIELRDDRVMYLTDSQRDALMILDRDPASGRLEFRRELRNGGDVEGVSGPAGMAIAPRGDWLYLFQTGSPYRLAAFAIDGAGDLTSAPDATCDCPAAEDPEITADGRRLVAGPLGPYPFDRDPDSGALQSIPPPRAVGSGGDELNDGSIVFSPDGISAYGIDWWEKRLLQYDSNPGGFGVKRIYHQGRDGQGIDNPRALLVSADGRHVYLSGGQIPTSSTAGTVAVFDRDPATGDLSFASLFRGPQFDGRPHHLQGRPPRVEINGGAEYTNDPDVLLSMADLGRHDIEIQISNDGGFKDYEHRRLDETNAYAWTLASTGPERLPKTVYVRLLGMSGYGGAPLTDSIVLDERAPVIVFARVTGGGSAQARKAAARRLSLRARDNLSGVSHVQITRNRKRPGKWVKFAKSLAVPAGRGALSVRVRDRAGNRSAWRTVSGG